MLLGMASPFLNLTVMAAEAALLRHRQLAARRQVLPGEQLPLPEQPVPAGQPPPEQRRWRRLLRP